MNTRNPRTARLIRLTGSQATIRLSAADRGFLKDLTRAHLVSSDLADRHHYGHLKGASMRSPSRLEAAGLITGRSLLPIQLQPLLLAPALTLAAWFQAATPWQEWMLALLVAVNVNAVLLPAFFGLGQALISASARFARKDIELKRRGGRMTR